MKKVLMIVLVLASIVGAQQLNSNCDQCKGQTCKTITSCSLAEFCLKQCRQFNLDADGDQIPCECDACKHKNPKPEKCKLYGK